MFAVMKPISEVVISLKLVKELGKNIPDGAACQYKLAIFHTQIHP